jgi:hypothetical protein
LWTGFGKRRTFAAATFEQHGHRRRRRQQFLAFPAADGYQQQHTDHHVDQQRDRCRDADA